MLLHGHARFTADLDLVLQLDAANVTAAFDALQRLGYRPRAPVALRDFADPAQQASWIADKGLTVFTLWSPELPLTEIDVFVEEPFPFDAAYARAVRAELAASTVTVANMDDLIALKQKARRTKVWKTFVRSKCSSGVKAMADEPLDGWQQHELEQGRAWLKTSYSERLRWLEGAKLLAHKALEAAAKRKNELQA